jgi:hypothetical protein
VINVDTAISSEHARVEFEPATGQFFICDGTPTKPSTNGTWYRYGAYGVVLCRGCSFFMGARSVQCAGFNPFAGIRAYLTFASTSSPISVHFTPLPPFTSTTG